MIIVGRLINSPGLIGQPRSILIMLAMIILIFVVLVIDPDLVGADR